MRVLDLSLPLDAATPVYPGDRKPAFARIATVERDGHAKQWMEMSTHTGTHIDSPAHMIAHGKTLSEFAIGHFVGDATVVDVRGQRQVMHSLDEIHKDDIVFFLMDDGAVLSEELAHDLVKKSARIIGVSTMSPDEEPYAVHNILLSHNIMIVENLVHLEELVGKRFRCVIAPLPLQQTDGAPCRVLALLA